MTSSEAIAFFGSEEAASKAAGCSRDLLATIGAQ